MSINQMLLAMKSKVGSPARKLVLIKLADNANDDGYCFPSYANLADHCEMSRRSVIVHINNLEKDGLLVKTQRKKSSGNTSNSYQLSIESRGEKSAPPSENISPPSEKSAPPLVKNLHPEPVTSLTSQLTSQKNKGKLDFSGMELSDADIKEVLRIRKQNKGGNLSQRAINGLAKEFKHARTLGFSDDDILTKWDVRGWKSFEACWMGNGQQQAVTNPPRKFGEDR